jgi:hypothetical protein
MAGFLTRLAGRTLGLAQRAEARPLSRYAPDPRRGAEPADADLESTGIEIPAADPHPHPPARESRQHAHDSADAARPPPQPMAAPVTLLRPADPSRALVTPSRSEPLAVRRRQASDQAMGPVTVPSAEGESAPSPSPPAPAAAPASRMLDDVEDARLDDVPIRSQAPAPSQPVREAASPHAETDGTRRPSPSAEPARRAPAWPPVLLATQMQQPDRDQAPPAGSHPAPPRAPSPAPRAAPRSPPVSDQAGVAVTIDRIEVRLPPPAPTAAPPRSAALGRIPSLSAYLSRPRR